MPPGCIHRTFSLSRHNTSPNTDFSPEAEGGAACPLCLHFGALVHTLWVPGSNRVRLSMLWPDNCPAGCCQDAWPRAVSGQGARTTVTSTLSPCDSTTGEGRDRSDTQGRLAHPEHRALPRPGGRGCLQGELRHDPPWPTRCGRLAGCYPLPGHSTLGLGVGRPHYLFPARM